MLKGKCGCDRWIHDKWQRGLPQDRGRERGPQTATSEWLHPLCGWWAAAACSAGAWLPAGWPICHAWCQGRTAEAHTQSHKLGLPAMLCSQNNPLICTVSVRGAEQHAGAQRARVPYEKGDSALHVGDCERCTLHCMRSRCHRTSGGSSFLMIASTLKSGCRRCMAKGLRPRNVSVPSRAQAGQTLCPDGFNTAGSMQSRQYLHNDIAFSSPHISPVAFSKRWYRKAVCPELLTALVCTGEGKRCLT